MKEMWDTSWDGLDEDELKARAEKYEALNAQMIEGTKRLIAERDTFAATSATLGQKADERGDDTRDLAKIVKSIEKETLEPGSSGNPFEPDGADATGTVPGQMLDTKVKELLQECKTSLDTVKDEATKKTINNLKLRRRNRTSVLSFRDLQLLLIRTFLKLRRLIMPIVQILPTCINTYRRKRTNKMALTLKNKKNHEKLIQKKVPHSKNKRKRIRKRRPFCVNCKASTT
jgi:hypothetical protein